MASAAAAPPGANPVVGQLNNPAYIRWLKATHALNWTVGVLRTFCDVEVKKLHQLLVNQCGGTPCNGPCSSSHVQFVARQWTINCPTNVCSNWLSAIAARRTRSNTRLAMSNVDIRQWQLQPWQVAKTYMGTGQDQSSTNSSDTDASGIIQLITNCKHFATIIDTTKVDAVSIHAYLPTYVNTYICNHAFTHTYIHTYLHSHTHTHAHAHAHAHTHTYTHTHIHTHVRPYVCTCLHPCMRTCIHACVRACVRIYIYIYI